MCAPRVTGTHWYDIQVVATHASKCWTRRTLWNAL